MTETSASLPLEKLVMLLPDSGELDARWGARRGGERIPFTKPVSITRDRVGSVDASDESAADASLDGWALNVCHGGMRIIVESTLEPGETVQLAIETSGKQYRGRAVVRWVRPQADGVVAGLAFMPLA